DPHGPGRSLEELIRRRPTLLPLAREFPKAELENARHAGRPAARLDGPVQLREIASRPEAVLEMVGVAARPADDQPLTEDDRPGGQRGQHQDAEHDLDGDARLQDETDDRKLLTHSHWLLQRENPAGASAATLRHRRTRP